ncbi:hypothetical protein AOLI_G00127640 [Acnodon oligacanthus]
MVLASRTAAKASLLNNLRGFPDGSKRGIRGHHATLSSFGSTRTSLCCCSSPIRLSCGCRASFCHATF